MKKLLTDFKAVYRDRILDLLWRQWTTVGLSGHGDEWRGSAIDPEALLLLTCTVGRYDARLFDGMLDWMGINGQYINVQRLKRIMATEGCAGEQVIRAVAATARNSVSATKWASTAATKAAKNPMPLFFLKDGKPMPTVKRHDPLFQAHDLLRDPYEARGVALLFRPEVCENLVLRLRALLGVNARCEIVEYLLLNELGSPSSLARDTYYFPLTISNAMTEMRDSGFLSSRVNGRRRDHRLVPEMWRDLFLGSGRPQWIVWPRFFRAIEIMWLFLHEAHLSTSEPLAQSSALRRVWLDGVVDRLETCGLAFTVGDLTAHPAESLIPYAIERLTSVLDSLMNPAKRSMG